MAENVAAAAGQERPALVTIQNLPTEIMLEILSSLSVDELEHGAAGVNLYWRQLAYDAWLRPSLRLSQGLVSSEDGRMLLRTALRTRCLELENRSDAGVLLRELAGPGGGGRNLRRIIISCCRPSPGRNTLPIRLLEAVFRHCFRISDVTITECTLAVNRLARGLAQWLPGLKKVNLNGTKGVGGRTINILLRGCNQLEEIRAFRSEGQYLFDIQDNVLDVNKLSRKLKRFLKVLEIAAISLSERDIPALALCSNLNTLHLHYALQLADEDLHQIAQLRRLVSLKITWATGVTAEGWMDFFLMRPWDLLHTLALPWCSELDDNGITCLANACPNLKVISIQGCSIVSKRGLRQLISHCHLIEYLNVNRCSMYIYKAFRLIPDNLPNIKILVYKEIGYNGDSAFLMELREANPEIEILEFSAEV